MKNLLMAAVALLLLVTNLSAAPLLGRTVQVESDIPTFDPNTFGPGPHIDVHHVILTNPNPEPVTWLDVRLLGDFLNFNAGSNLIFKNTPELPMLGPNRIPESFVVVPPGFQLPPICVGCLLEPPGRLEFFFTIDESDQDDYLPAGGSTVVAVLSVPPGTAIDTTDWAVSARVGGVSEPVLFVPEPAAAWQLAGLLIAWGAARRRAG